MLKYIDSLNNQKPYLTHHQPTEETVKVLETLYDFFAGTLSHSNFRYQKELQVCNLDYSLNSIKRIDEMLERFKQTLTKFDKDKIYSSSYPLNSDMTLHVLAYYLGELVGRVRQEAPIWYSSYREEERFEQVNSIPFEVMVAEFERDIETNTGFIFHPMQLIYKALITSEKSSNVEQNIIWQGIQDFIPSSALNEIDLDEPLKPAPVMALQFDRQSAFKQLDLADLAYLQVIPPQWMLEDSLFSQMEQLNTLYETGKVVWAQIVQANKLLFSPEEAYSCPAEIIYDPTGRTPPTHLAQVAHRLYNLKHTIPDEPELIEYAQHITNEFTRVVGKTVPDIITKLPLKTSSIFIWRSHLPNGILHDAFPILISDTTEEVTLLPAKFWDKVYYSKWMKDSYFKEDMYYSLRNLYVSDNPWQNLNRMLKPSTQELLRTLPINSDAVEVDSNLSFLDEGFARRCIYTYIDDIQTSVVDYKKIVFGVIIFVVILKLTTIIP